MINFAKEWEIREVLSQQSPPANNEEISIPRPLCTSANKITINISIFCEWVQYAEDWTKWSHPTTTFPTSAETSTYFRADDGNGGTAPQECDLQQTVPVALLVGRSERTKQKAHWYCIWGLAAQLLVSQHGEPQSVVPKRKDDGSAWTQTVLKTGRLLGC